MIVFLDTGVLGLVASPNNTGEAKECKEWLYSLLARSVYVVSNRPKIKCLKSEFMSTYNEVLNQVQQLSISEKLRLSEELKNILNQGVEVEGDSEVIRAEEIAESEAAWQDYLAGRDRGISSNAALVSCDPIVAQYPVNVIW
ncbi:hypothetical protein [Floridanema evergladense]|uniref:PIN domain-containing protein n=1 Tax=Floridaenema evergladense BLCC-F167 TaxID=3153639 RepID=A0ABV4WGY1_9CYAN